MAKREPGGTGRQCRVMVLDPPVPDLTDVDLRVLRTVDHGALAVAVEDVLNRPRRLAETWWGGETGDA